MLFRGNTRVCGVFLSFSSSGLTPFAAHPMNFPLNFQRFSEKDPWVQNGNGRYTWKSECQAKTKLLDALDERMRCGSVAWTPRPQKREPGGRFLAKQLLPGFGGGGGVTATSGDCFLLFGGKCGRFKPLSCFEDDALEDTDEFRTGVWE